MIQVNKCDNEGNYSETIKQNFFGECEYVIDRLHNERVCVIGYNEKDNQFWIESNLIKEKRASSKNVFPLKYAKSADEID